MFMVSKLMYDAHYQPRGLLRIEPYEPTNHISNFYYFRLGAKDEDGKVVEIGKSLFIPKTGFVRVWSLEAFTFTERILGLFGSLSALVAMGLQLVHSPSIDPGFTGRLALGIRNNTAEPVELTVGANIGKLLFFDVSDSIISAEEFVENVVKKMQLAEREKAGKVVLRAYGDVRTGGSESG